MITLVVTNVENFLLLPTSIIRFHLYPLITCSKIEINIDRYIQKKSNSVKTFKIKTRLKVTKKTKNSDLTNILVKNLI